MCVCVRRPLPGINLGTKDAGEAQSTEETPRMHAIDFTKKEAAPVLQQKEDVLEEKKIIFT